MSLPPSGSAPPADSGDGTGDEAAFGPEAVSATGGATGRPPRISVLLPVHNGADYIESALRSVMDQTLRDIEILVVDDASTDATPAILDRLAGADPRIRILRPETNLRLPRALNFGLDHARGDYVARMDADDLCEPDRFARQARFLDTHPDIVLVGCSAVNIDAEGTLLRAKVRAHTPFCARWMLRFGMPFRHPSLMFRRREMTLRYDPAATVSEDYDLLARLTETSKVACLPDVLLRYRVHDKSLSGSKWALMMQEARRIAQRVQAADLASDTAAALAPFNAVFFDGAPLDPARAAALFAGLRQMVAADTAAHPRYRRWVRWQTADLAAHVLIRSGAARREMLEIFLRHGADFLPSLGLRVLEARRILPSALRSEPDVWRQSA